MGIEIDGAPELEALLSRILSPVRRTCAVLHAAAAGNYTAGDVISSDVDDTEGGPTELRDFARVPGGTGTITAIRAKCSEDAVLVTLRLHFFDLPPTPAEVEMDDNIAFTIATAGGHNKYLGAITLNAFVDKGAALSGSDTVDLFESFKCREGQTSIWFVVEATTAEANETAGMSLTFDVYVI